MAEIDGGFEKTKINCSIFNLHFEVDFDIITTARWPHFNLDAYINID